MTHIGPDVSIVGDIECADDLIIDGRVRGRVNVRDFAIIVTTQGGVRGDIRGARVFVHGHVHGSIWASERIELAPTAVVEGSVSANRVIIAEGAVVHGRIDMNQRTIASKVARFKTEPTVVPT